MNTQEEFLWNTLSYFGKGRYNSFTIKEHRFFVVDKVKFSDIVYEIGDYFEWDKTGHDLDYLGIVTDPNCRAYCGGDTKVAIFRKGVNSCPYITLNYMCYLIPEHVILEFGEDKYSETIIIGDDYYYSYLRLVKNRIKALDRYKSELSVYKPSRFGNFKDTAEYMINKNGLNKGIVFKV